MTFQHTGHGCLSVGGVLGSLGIHLPEHKRPTLQERINEHHEQVTQHINDARDRANNTINGIKDAVQSHLPGGGGSGGLTGGHPDPGERGWMMGGHPLNLIFGDPVAAEAHHFSLAAIPVGGGVTLSLMAFLVAIAMIVVIASMVTRAVTIRVVEFRTARAGGDVVALPALQGSGC